MSPADEAKTNFWRWVSRLVPYGKAVLNYTEWRENAIVDGDYFVNLEIYTDTYKYSIIGKYTKSTTYLGCIAYIRKPYPGEVRLRSKDLADGAFNEKTFEKICFDIISNEMRPIVQTEK
jgi:hypothetical protein